VGEVNPKIINVAMKSNDALIIEIQQTLEVLNFANPFFLLLNVKGKLIGIGDAYKKLLPNLKELDDFSDHFFWEKGLSTPRLDKALSNQVLHTHIKNDAYDVSIRNTSFGVLILNTQGDSNAASERIQTKKTAALPGENPNPVLRFSNKLELLYANKAAEQEFLTDFQIHSDGVKDYDLKINLLNCLKRNVPSLKIFLSRAGKNYMISIVNVIEKGYLNIYANDISLFITQVEEKEEELRRLTITNDEQRNFYEYILNNLPSDIAVFSPEHKYLFINPQAIKDKDTREFMIGKDDFDYCNLKGIPTDSAKFRRAAFSKVKEGNKEIEWEDELLDFAGNRKVILRKMAPVFDIDEQLRYVVGYGIDITAIKLSQDILQKNNLFQATLMDLATKYINLPIEKMDVTINESLSQLGNFVHVDRVYIFTYDHKSKTASNTYEWCAEGIGPQIDNLQFIPFSSIPFWIETHAKGDEIIIEKTTQLPDGTVKEMLLEQDIKSVFALPLMKGNKCIGFVGFDAVLDYRSFYEDEKDLLRLFGKMLVNLEIQTNFLKQISAKTEEIQNMNTDLELIVAEKTKRNIELSKSITDQEKLVTIGEIASGIAHDLNTPLGAIKIGAESIRYTTSELLKNIVWKCSEEQIKFACERSAQKQGELFLGGLQLRREIKEFEDYLSLNFPALKAESSEIAGLFVKSRISISETKFIKQCMETENRKDFLLLIYHTQLNRNFIETILSSSERGAKVVQDLRSFIKEPQNTSKGMVNLRENIATVLTIFNYELKRNIDVEFTVPDSLSLLGFDIKLFQLWSNIIKNAIEAMDDKKERGKLKINGKKTKKGIELSIENNGPLIPEQIQQKIFEKYFTTKSGQNGSGLGLSIVKNVLVMHNATISLNSTSVSTTFTIFFNE
jgi:signal transduction histidine kinase/PAS domain-containing protein